jgi:hypothetical protein
MKDFKVGKTPALDAHVLGHDGEAFGFDLPDVTSAQRVRITHPPAAGLSLPKIISERIGGAVQPGSEWRPVGSALLIRRDQASLVPMPRLLSG